MRILVKVGVFLINLIISGELMCSAAFRIFVTIFRKLRHSFRKERNLREECFGFVFEVDCKKNRRNFPQTAPNVASA